MPKLTCVTLSVHCKGLASPGMLENVPTIERVFTFVRGCIRKPLNVSEFLPLSVTENKVN